MNLPRVPKGLTPPPILAEPKISRVWHEDGTTFVEVTLGKRKAVQERPTRDHRLFPIRTARELSIALGEIGADVPTKDLAKAVAKTLPEVVRRRPARRTPTRQRLRENAQAAKAHAAFVLESGEQLLREYRKGTNMERSPGPDPGKHPDAERGPMRIGEPVGLQLVAIVEAHPLFEAWRHGDTSDAYFGMAVLEDLEDEWERKGNDLPVTLYGPMEPLCEAEIEALNAVGNTDDAEGRLRPGMRRSD